MSMTLDDMNEFVNLACDESVAGLIKAFGPANVLMSVALLLDSHVLMNQWGYAPSKKELAEFRTSLTESVETMMQFPEHESSEVVVGNLLNRFRRS